MPQPTRIYSTTPTCDTNAYAAGDAIGGRLEFQLEKNCSRGVLVHVTATLEITATQPELDLVLFDRPFQATANNSPFGPTTADLQTARIGVINIPAADWKTFANNEMVTVNGLALAIELQNTPGILYGQLITRTIVTLGSASDLTIAIGMLLD